MRLQLNVDEFNDGEFGPYLRRACESGIEFATFADGALPSR
ncbi:hypothetical protein V6U90_03090 [Micromonospora sp. CPCC 206060]